MTVELDEVKVHPVEGNGHNTEPPEELAELQDLEPREPETSPIRATVACLCTAVAAGVLAGGIFTDIEARVYAILAAIVGGLLALGVQRIKSSALSNVAIVVGLFAIGLAAGLAVSGLDSFTHLKALVAQAIQQAHLVRPPISITGGFAALLGWIMGGVGFVAVWLAVALKRPSLGLLLPLPVAVVAAISVSQGEQVVDGIVLLVATIAGLAISAGGRDTGTEGEGLPLAFELRRAAKAVPVIAIGTGAVILLAQTGFLFPRPVVAPQYQAQRPKTQPLSAVQDRVLFEVKSSITGPWVVGALDVYDGHDWLLPAFHDADLRDIPADGRVDHSLQPALDAVFTIRGQTGAVLPTLPNTVGILAQGPKLDYDARSGNIRLLEGEIQNGFSYRVAAAAVPSIGDLQKVSVWPDSTKKYTDIPAAPSAVQELIAKAPKSSKWDTWDYLRRWVLDNVTAGGLGTPVSISPDRVARIIQKKEASPYEIVATEAMLARWVGLPSRIGYGFDGGVRIQDHLEIHPRDGAAFPEVFFPGSGWLPVLGQPAHAKVAENSNPKFQQFRQGVLPSQDIAVPLFLPGVVPPESTFVDDLRNAFLVAAAILAVLALLYILYPAVAKLLIRSRRRTAARALGPRGRISQAYSEWRDLLTDYGYRHHSDTPLMLLDRFPADEDHAELAWLVTRALWGDLQGNLDDSIATDAEEIASTLKRRLAQAHPITVRAVAVVSRLSLREPFTVPEHAEQHATRPKEMAHAV